MANQIVVSSGAKVRNLNDVIIGTSGVLSSLAFNVANGVPKLDVNGKILVSQLPNSVMEYQGTWNAATNTPTLVNGTGNQGDVYLCNVAGTVNFGAGPIAFFVGDQVIYSGSIWQRASGATGTVTSVAVTESGDSLNITGSPITTSGTINIGFNGTNLQYINGAGDLTTFPTLLSSVGLSMPSAFNVSNSPLTANGTIGVTGAGVASQYIRGDGTLADFPTSGGGGSSVSYYLNGGTSQGVIGGITYYEMSKIADTGTGVDFPKTGDGLIVSFLTDANDPSQLNIPAGNWNYEIYASMSSNGGTPQMYAELYKYDGTTFTLISTSSNEILYDGTNLNLYTFAMTVPATTLAVTDRLAIKLYATNSGGKTTTVHTQDSHLCQVITTFSTGITALNGLTAQVQYFATGTSGTDFAISSSTATHTFNLPTASATNRGALSSADWTTFNNKLSTATAAATYVPYTGATTNVTLGAFNLTADNIILNSGLASLTRDLVNNFGSLVLRRGANGIIIPTTLSVDRYYTLPNATGTIALTSDIPSLTGYVTLATTQTITGQKTFSLDILVNGLTIGIGGGSIVSNTAIGQDALDVNTTGYGNTSVGNNALRDNTTGFFNAAIGVNALQFNTIGTYNNALGTASLYNNTTGSYNTAVGQQAGTSNTTGSNNTYIGRASGANIITGSNNIIIGNYSGTAAMANNIVLADGAGNVRYQWDGTNNVFGNSISGTSADFSSSVSALELLLDSAGTASATFVKNTNGTGVISTGSNQIGFNLNNNFFITSDNKGCSIFSFNHSSSAYTYTLPSANGTIALTTDLGSYLPLAGGTLTGALNGTSAVFSSTVQASAYRLTGMTGGSGALYWSSDRVTLANYNATGVVQIEANGGTSVAVFGGATYNNDFVGTGRFTGIVTFGSTLSNGTYAYTLPSATGTLALTSQIPSFSGTTNYHAKFTSGTTIGNSLIWDNGTNVGIGNTNTSYTLDVSGTGRFTGALTAAGLTLTTAGSTSAIISGTGTNVYSSLSLTNTTTGYGYDIGFGGSASIAPNSFYIYGGSSASVKFLINSAGNVGIGTSSPSGKLMLFQGTAGNVLQNIVSNQGGSTQVGINLSPSMTEGEIASNPAQASIYATDSNYGANIIFANKATGAVGNALTERMRITSGGVLYVGASSIPNSGSTMNVIGTSTSLPLARFFINAASTLSIPTIRFDKYDNNSTTSQVFVDFTINNQNNGNGSITANGASQATFTTWSDRRLKENITELPSQLQNILALKPCEFDYNDGSGHQIGFIAQEIQEVYPDAIGENAQGFLTVSGWNKTEARLVKAIQEMNTKIEELSKQNEELSNRLIKLENK
jgi:hypothetical protein